MIAAPTSEAWIQCDCGSEHWGTYGAAGLLLVRLDEAQNVSHVLLQHRAQWVDQGGTWSIPGGALHHEESAEEGAFREAHEEIRLVLKSKDVLGASVVSHGNWAYTTVIAVVTEAEFDAEDAESDAVAWIPVEEIDALPLHGGFAAGWSSLQKKINTRAL